MRIAVNTRFLLKDKLEGIGRFTFEVLKRMTHDHPDDEFIFFFDRPFDPSFVFEKNVTPVVLFPPARHPWLFVWWYEFSVARALKKYKPDVFLSTDNFGVLHTKVPTVLVVHDIAYTHFPDQVSYLHRRFYQKYTPKFLKKAARIVTVSNFTKEDILTQFPIPDQKIAVACNGCDDDFQPVKKEIVVQIRREYADGSPYFIYVGAIHPRKNVHRIIWAFNKFKANKPNNVKLLIVGRNAWMNKAVKAAYEGAQFKNDIKFVGYIKREKLPLLLGSALGLVYVSLFEGFGIPILEAMHAEVPVITSHSSSMPEVAGDAAVYVNPIFVKEIAKAMQFLNENKEMRASLIERGRQQRQKFSWKRATEVVYENLKLASERR